MRCRRPDPLRAAHCLRCGCGFRGQVRNAFCASSSAGPPCEPLAAWVSACLILWRSRRAPACATRPHAERVFIADWDVHHGNGTQEIFYEDGSVLFFSTHQSPWYPGTGARNETGAGAGAGHRPSIALFPPVPDEAEKLGAFHKQLVPAATAFHPDLVLLSAGFDSRGW